MNNQEENIMNSKVEIEQFLTEAIMEKVKGTEYEDCEIKSFKDNLVTMDNGIIIDLPDGKRIKLIIQAELPSGRSMQ